MGPTVGWNSLLIELFWPKLCSNGSRKGWIRLWPEGLNWRFGAETDLFNFQCNLCFTFLLCITAVPREIENNAYAKCWGSDSNRVHYGKSGSGILWVLVVTDWKKKHLIPSFSIGSSPVADRCFVTLLAKKREQISANFDKQIANFRFRRKIGEISMHVLF